MQLSLFSETAPDDPRVARTRHPTSRKERHGLCSVCGRDHRWYESMLYQLPENRQELYRLTCHHCRRYYSGQIKEHRLRTDLALRLMLARVCECCAQALPRHHGRIAVVVDHDHRCCPVDSASCGECVRGFVCRSCNVALGWYEAADLAQLRAYLDRAAR